MSRTDERHARAAELAHEYLPEYLAAWIAGTLLETQTLPALVEHQDRLAMDVLKIAMAQSDASEARLPGWSFDRT